MSARPLIVYGAGGHGKVVADILIARGEKVMGFLDDTTTVGTKVLGLPVLGSSVWLDANPNAQIALGVGNNVVRERTAELCLAKGADLVTAIHPSAVIAHSAVVEEGAVVMALAVDNPDSVVGRGAIINTCAVVEHDCVVGAFAHISPNATFGGNCAVGAFAQLGIGATMLPGTKIGEHSIVGAGGLVTHDIPQHTIAVGVPARTTRSLGRDSISTADGEARLLSPSAPQWADALRRTDHDVYHLPEYVSLDANVSGGTPAAFWYQEEGHALLLPLILRDIPDSDLRDAVSPYGYPGPVSDASPEDTAFWRRACDQMIETLRADRVITTFVRLHPLLPVPLDVLAGAGAVVHHGETVSLDLSLGIEEMWHQTRRDHRNQINRARRAGVEVVFDDWERLDEWVAVYHENMRRLGASKFYLFPCEHLAALHEAVGDRMHLAVALLDGEVVGGNTFFEYRGMIEGYVASSRHHDGHHADKLLYDEIRRWAKDRGNAIFHFGGGVGGAKDSLFSYKAGFSSGRHSFYTWRVVTHAVAYAELLARRGGRPESVDMSGYLQSYL